jgi:hypothetical protein
VKQNTGVKLIVGSVEWNQWRVLKWSGTPVSFAGKRGRGGGVEQQKK